MPHVIEPASSGRAKCRGCDQKIAKGELRFGERRPNIFGDGESEMTLWFHLACGAYKRPESFVEALAGEDLENAEHLGSIAEFGKAHRRVPRVNGAERAPSGRARCRSCKEMIERGVWRISLVYFQEYRFDPAGFVHATCAGEYFETTHLIDRIKHFSPQLSPGDLDDLNAALTTTSESRQSESGVKSSSIKRTGCSQKEQNMSGQSANIHAETIGYTANGTTLKGYLAYDKGAEAKRPGVLVVHEWWGLNDYIRRRARMLAELGYTALAVDMYGDGITADNPDEAGRLMNSVLQDMKQGEARFKAGYELLSGQSTTDAAHVAAIGYCFGGAMVLHAARIGMDLDGVVSFHGSLGSAHKPAPGSVRAKTLVCHGAADSLVPDADITAFKQEMDKAGADYRFVSYQGALHGFTNPDADAKGKKYGLPLAYSAETDQRSWQAMQDFFNAIFA